MTRDELTTDLTETIAQLSAKVREAVTMGKPGEAVEYADALCRAAEAYWQLATEDA